MFLRQKHVVNSLMKLAPGMSVNIKYTVALFSALHVSVRKKQHATCTIFSAFCTKPNDPLCCKRPRQSLYINLFHSLSPSDRLIFRNSLSLFGAGILEKKRVRFTAHLCLCHVNKLNRGLWPVLNNYILYQPFGWIHILNRVSQSSFGIVARTCPCIKFVNAGDLE